jgi:hypothetical protein
MLFMPAGRYPAVEPPYSSLNPLYSGQLAAAGITSGDLIGGLKGHASELFYQLSCRGSYAARSGSAGERKNGQEGL